jgi:23S rRNA (pseudouridine1915-N3)-methyltransferase
MKLILVAVGQLKSGPERDLIQIYNKRLRWSLDVHEVVVKRKISGPALKELEGDLILSHIPSSSLVIGLDEKGKSLNSQEFATLLKDHQTHGQGPITFIIGGADGLANKVRDKTHHLISFGHLTWPHMLVRVLLLEQLYRAQQILAGHPYHRE